MGDGSQPGTQLAQALVVHRVAVGERRGAGGDGESRAVGDGDRVLAHPMAATVEVLDEGAALGDVQDLHAAADRQHRQVAFDRGMGEREVELVVQAHHAVQRIGLGDLAVSVRLDVAAARQQQPAEAIEVGVHHRRRGGKRRQQHRQPARLGDRAAVGLAARERVAPTLVRERQHAAADADERR